VIPDLARIENKVPETVPRPTICFDEWNVWDPVRAPGEEGAEEKYTLSDALAVAVFLNGFIRQAKDMGMANIAVCQRHLAAHDEQRWAHQADYLVAFATVQQVHARAHHCYQCQVA
jgi:alpha-L-arabinofuranosidase